MSNDMTWSDRADLAQAGLTTVFGAPWPQYLDNWSPGFPGSNDTFNYWWLAHVIDARLDAFVRTGDTHWLAEAQQVRRNLVERNGGGLFNDYFDDMTWFGLALERLGRLGADPQATTDAIALWQHCRALGWNPTYGWSLAWRVPQLEYKNTPANGPFAILGARLFQATNDHQFLDLARAAFDWITHTLRTPSGFIEDGINRLGDGRIDTQWRFTYNQGLYIGAGVALAEATADQGFLDAVWPTIDASLTELTEGGVFRSEGDDGDEGLFKGIYYRYAAAALHAREHPTLRSFVEGSTNMLWSAGFTPDSGFLPGNDWRRGPTGPVPYSTYLSALMALEARAGLTP